MVIPVAIQKAFVVLAAFLTITSQANMLMMINKGDAEIREHGSEIEWIFNDVEKILDEETEIKEFRFIIDEEKMGSNMLKGRIAVFIRENGEVVIKDGNEIAKRDDFIFDDDYDFEEKEFTEQEVELWQKMNTTVNETMTDFYEKEDFEDDFKIDESIIEEQREEKTSFWSKFKIW